MRKVIQISELNSRLVALCDDGTMWELFDDLEDITEEDGPWVQIPAIPQDEDDDDDDDDDNDDETDCLGECGCSECIERVNADQIVAKTAAERVLKMHNSILRKRLQKLLDCKTEKEVNKQLEFIRTMLGKERVI